MTDYLLPRLLSLIYVQKIPKYLTIKHDGNCTDYLLQSDQIWTNLNKAQFFFIFWLILFRLSSFDPLIYSTCVPLPTPSPLLPSPTLPYDIHSLTLRSLGIYSF